MQGMNGIIFEDRGMVVYTETEQQPKTFRSTKKRKERKNKTKQKKKKRKKTEATDDSHAGWRDCCGHNSTETGPGRMVVTTR